MSDLNPVNPVAMTVFVAFFLLVTVLGFVAARWKAGDLTQLHEWGLGGRQFGTVISWFLVGGDFYTAYTVIAVPALVYSVGAYGFFALPYTIIVYPFVFAVMPKLWKIAHAKNHITAADYVQGEYGGKWFPAAVALTGIVATMPYIALQLVGMQVVIKGLGISGEAPLVIAFIILALYTYTSGLRAPAMIAFVKDIMIYIVVIAAVWLIPSKLGGYGHVFDAADTYFKAKGGATGIILKPTQFTAYASLALGSALAAFMYPHTMTAVLSSSSMQTVRKNAIFLPAYTLLLGLIALLGGGHCDQRAGARRYHVDRRGEPVHAQSVASAGVAEHGACSGSIDGEDRVTRRQVRRAAVHRVPAHAVRDRPATARRRVDSADLPGHRVLVVYAPSEHAGAVLRLAGRHRARHGTRDFAGPQARVRAACRRFDLAALYRPDRAGRERGGDVHRFDGHAEARSRLIAL